MSTDGKIDKERPSTSRKENERSEKPRLHNEDATTPRSRVSSQASIRLSTKSRNGNENSENPHLHHDDATSRTSKTSSRTSWQRRSISHRLSKRSKAFLFHSQRRKSLMDQRSSQNSTSHGKGSSIIRRKRRKKNWRKVLKAMGHGKDKQNSCSSHNSSDKPTNSCFNQEGSVKNKNRDEPLRSNNYIKLSPGNHRLSAEENDCGTISIGSVDSNKNPRLDIKLITMWFSDSIKEPTNIDINSYIMGYEELLKMSKVLGPVFKIVGNEMRSKLNRMIDLQNEDTDNHYFSMLSMIAYEIGTQLISTPGFESGCRTFLRLNRGLEFLSKFLERVTKMEPGELAGRAACEVYYETMGQYQKWLQRKSALLLLPVGLPAKETVLRKMCGNNWEEALQDLPKMIEVINEVINRTNFHFKSHNILNLS